MRVSFKPLWKLLIDRGLKEKNYVPEQASAQPPVRKWAKMAMSQQKF